MTLSEFYEKYKNGVDYDGAYGKQCVDYVNMYAQVILGIVGAFVGPQYAYQCYTDYEKYSKINTNFKRIANSTATLNHPQAYDVIVWSRARNGYAGHIAIVTEATAHTITVIEQNYDGKGSVRKHTYDNYNCVLGWLRPKKLPQSKPAPVKKNRPTVKKGDTVVLKTSAKVYKFDRNDSPVVRICDMSQFTSKSQCVLKKGAKVVVDEVIVKKNNNIWIKSDKYKGYIGIYSYQSDTSKV